MGDPHTRSMEGGWNPGEVWPVPVDCLLNGMQADAHVMFGGGPVFAPHFRHRFQPPIHLSSAHLETLPDSLNVSIPLTQHSLVESGNVEETGDSCIAVQDGGRDGHSLSQSLPTNVTGVLEDSEDGSEDDDDDEVDDGLPVQMVHGLEQHHHTHAGPVTISHGMEPDSLVQCQQQVVPNTLQQPTLLQIDGSQIQHCMQQQKNDEAVRHNHPSHTQHIDSIITPVEDDFANQGSSDGDPNSGFSVQGKMYFEGRVVLHLKQWTDPQTSDNNSVGMGDIGNGFSYAEQQHTKGFQGCAVCRLKSNHENNRNHKEAHRHTVKGVLFTFEDCIIVELYPENSSGINATVDPKPRAESQQPNNHPMSIETYMNSAITIPPEHHQRQEQVKKYVHHIDVNCISNSAPQNPPTKHGVTLSQAQGPEDQSWWDEFETNENLKRSDVEDELESNSGPENESCIPLKLHSIHTATATSDDDTGEFEVESHSPCPPYLTPPQLVDQSCQNPSVISLDDSDLNSGPPSGISVNGSVENDVAILQSSEESQQSVTTLASTQTIELSPSVVNVESSVSKSRILQFCCPLCNKSFPVKRTLKQHLEQNHPNKNPWRCSICDQHFTDAKRLKKHACALLKGNKGSRKSLNKTLSSEITDYSLGDCNGKDFSEEDGNSNESKQGNFVDALSPSDLKHLPEDSSSSADNILDVDQENSGGEDGCKSSQRFPHKITKKGDKPYKCDVCDKRFTVERRLRNHKLSHNAERSSQCDKCGKRFARKDKLMRHMYVHSAEKMFSCDICQKRFSRRDKLSDHLKSHGGADEIHNCPMCQKQFLRPDILKQHVKLHKMGNKHQCSECLRFVTGKDRLEKHMARHKEAKVLGQTLLCPLCTKYFIQKQSLKAHIKKFHPNSNINIDSQDSELDQQQLVCQPPSSSQLDSNSSSKSNKFRCEDVSGSKCFECNHCHRIFSKKATFKKHLRKHQASPLTSPNDSVAYSPSPEEDDSLLALPSKECHSLSNSNNSACIQNPSPDSAQAILPASNPSAPSKIIDTNSDPNLVTSSRHAVIQENLSAHCSDLQHLTSLETHSQPGPNQLLAASHTSHPTQVTSMTHPDYAVHGNLSQHMSGPAVQHHISMATHQPMCDSSFVLAYPQYPYQ